jgi:hypothetical protein
MADPQRRKPTCRARPGCGDRRLFGSYDESRMIRVARVAPSEGTMNLSAPKQIIFIIALVIAIIALLMFLNVFTFVAIPAFWVMTLAYAVLAVGCLIKGA